MGPWLWVAGGSSALILCLKLLILHCLLIFSSATPCYPPHDHGWPGVKFANLLDDTRPLPKTRACRCGPPDFNSRAASKLQAGIRMSSRKARILVLCKTYPSPSGKHVETSCVAGMEVNGRLLRLFPIPFRFIEDDKQFKKWQWITARIEKARNDHRAESHKVFIDTILRDGEPISTRAGWRLRRDQIRKMPTFDDFVALDAARVTGGVTLGLLQPSRVLALEITPTDTGSRSNVPNGDDTPIPRSVADRQPNLPA
jgi:hypothetical protein